MIKESEYMFASSFIRAGDSAGTAAERLARFTEAGSVAALRAAVSEAFRLNVQVAEGDAGALYDAALCDAVEKLRGAVPDFSVYAPLLYKYDCTNVKTAVKASARGIELTRGMLFDCGSVPCEKILNCAQSGRFEGLPPEMEKAAGEAKDAYGKTGEVRAIDLILDRACYMDMANGAKAGGVGLICDIVSMRADGVNVLAAMRIAASGMPGDSQKSLMERAFVPGGEIPPEAFVSADGCAHLSDIAARAVQSKLSAAVHTAADTHDISFVECEKLFDEAVLTECDKYRFKPFGPEIAVRYLVIRESEVMNARIIEAGLSAGMSGERIKERLREAYV